MSSFHDHIIPATTITRVLSKPNIGVSVLRLDQIHPAISGNKWFKLKYYLQDAETSGKDHIITFGGAYSNHIAAMAAVCQLKALKATGVIRGERPSHLSHTLLQAIEDGMRLVFVSRKDYRDKRLPLEIALDDSAYIINEGGYGILGVMGAAEILACLPQNNYSHIACAVGTSTTMAGLVKSSLAAQEVIGIPVLKNPELEPELRHLLSVEERKKKFKMIHDYHFGGYAKHPPELIRFMNELYRNTDIPTDFVYTGKLFYGIIDLIEKNYFPAGSEILVIHSGGLQGNLSLPPGSLIF